MSDEKETCKVTHIYNWPKEPLEVHYVETFFLSERDGRHYRGGDGVRALRPEKLEHMVERGHVFELVEPFEISENEEIWLAPDGNHYLGPGSLERADFGKLKKLEVKRK